MLCRISDLYVKIPEAGSLAPRCGEYLTNQSVTPDIVIDKNLFRYEKLPDDPEMVEYLESGFQFYRQLLKFDGMMLHASAVVYENKAYLFSGPCGVGKSTHARIWQNVFGNTVEVINDDKPALRLMDGEWFAFGTPWCGKDGINKNRKVSLSAICFLKQAEENQIRQLAPKEALFRIMSQTLHRNMKKTEMDMLLNIVDKLLADIPVFEFNNLPNADAAWMSFQAMQNASMEAHE